jgi:NDP-sugar pyrophosphorylase family protein
MKAMILAAGLGSRLGTLTQNTPKCLMSVGEKTLLQLVIEKIIRSGVEEVVINLHYLSDQVQSYLDKNENFGVSIQLSHETTLLGTGGAVAKVGDFFANDECFIIYNSDVYSEINLADMVRTHQHNENLATLAVVKRDSSRPLFFNEEMQLVGWENQEKQTRKIFGEGSQIPFGFTGVHVVSHRLFSYFNDYKSPFSIIDPYIEAAKTGEPIIGYDIGESYWIDAGVPERLQELRLRTLA